MRLTRFLITSMIDRRKTWIIAAGDMQSAWRRFVAEGYGGDVHDAGAYDIRYHSFTIIPRKGSGMNDKEAEELACEAAAQN